jgi:hypothetical protein
MHNFDRIRSGDFSFDMNESTMKQKIRYEKARDKIRYVSAFSPGGKLTKTSMPSEVFNLQRFPLSLEAESESKTINTCRLINLDITLPFILGIGS